MSSLTREQIGVLARRRTGADESERPRFEALVDDALKSLARKVARRADFREFRKTVNVTSVSGVITLSDDTVLFETLAETGVLILNGVTVRWVARRADLTLKKPRDAYEASVAGRLIYVVDYPAGATGVVSQSGTLECSCVLTLVQMPGNYDEELIDEVVRLSGGKAEKSEVPALDGAAKGEGLNVSLDGNG